MHPDTRLRDVRHAVATELGRRGVHPVIVSALGHASPAFTIAVYQHAWQEGLAEAVQALEAALNPSPALAIRWPRRRRSLPETGVSSRSRSSEEWGGRRSLGGAKDRDVLLDEGSRGAAGEGSGAAPLC
jgi:hypothetical protein